MGNVLKKGPTYSCILKTQTFRTFMTVLWNLQALWALKLLGALIIQLLFKLCLCYDNMCNLLRLNISKYPLPLEYPYSMMWLWITKLIDAFHLKNHHIDRQCQVYLNPKRIEELHPNLKGTRNTQVAEQTFVW